MTELIKEEELQKYGISQQMLLEKFYAQLRKDFEMSGLESYFGMPEETSFETMKSSLSGILSRIPASSSSKLQELIYRVDIPDRQYSEALRNATGPAIDVLAELLIKRILQKVILKIVYSK